MKDLLGDYDSFFADLLERLEKVGIDIRGCPLSHLAFRTATFEEYEVARDRIWPRCIGNAENVWNGRPISKLLLREPLPLAGGFSVPLIELIPPRHRGEYPMGLEHLGVVIGSGFEAFAEQHRPVLSGKQDQGPVCQPAYITFDSRHTVKFYQFSLGDVVAREGGTFAAPA